MVPLVRVGVAILVAARQAPRVALEGLLQVLLLVTAGLRLRRLVVAQHGLQLPHLLLDGAQWRHSTLLT